MDDDLKSASDSMNEPAEQSAYRPSASRPPRRFPKKLFIALFIILVVASGAFAVWVFILNKPDTGSEESAPSAVTQAAKEQIGEDVPDAALSETYNSTALSIGLKYPKTWKVSEATGGIRIESPKFSFPGANLGSVEGIFRVYIRQGARSVDGKYIGDGLAIKSSEKLVYTQPAVGQRADTLLSSFGSNSIDIFTFFLIAGNFQLKIGDTLGPDYGREPDAYIVAGGYTTTAAIDDLAMTSVATDYYATTNAYKQALGIIGSLQLK